MAIWPDPDDEPERPDSAVYYTVWFLRQLNYPIETENTRGWRFAAK